MEFRFFREFPGVFHWIIRASRARLFAGGEASPLRVATGGEASWRLEAPRRRSPAPREYTARVRSGQFASRQGRLENNRMQDFQLYQQILGLTEPWRVEQVTLKPKDKTVEVRVGYADTLWGCPQCQQRMRIHDYEERRWRHLDSCQFQTIIVSRVPVVRCPTHGTQTVAVPWAEKYARFTRLFERFAIDVMLECSISGACDILKVSWDEADGIKQRAVKRGLARKEPKVMEWATATII